MKSSESLFTSWVAIISSKAIGMEIDVHDYDTMEATQKPFKLDTEAQNLREAVNELKSDLEDAQTRIRYLEEKA